MSEAEEIVEVEEVEVVDETEQQAKAQGWAPQDQWKGDPDKWVDAKTFLDKGEKIRAIKDERMSHLTNQVAELRDLLVGQKDMAKKARVQGYKQALEEIEQRQLEAVENVDTEGFKKAKADEKRIMKEIEQENLDDEPKQDEIDPNFAPWLKENEWFDRESPKFDLDMFAYASTMSNIVQQQTGLSSRALYDEVTKRVKANFPHKFSNPRRNEAGAVETGGAAPIKKKSGRTFDDLPDSAKQSFQRLAKQFKMGGIEYTKEEYLSNYVWD